MKIERLEQIGPFGEEIQINDYAQDGRSGAVLSSYSSLGNPGNDRQRFVDAVVLISAPDWLVGLLNFERH